MRSFTCSVLLLLAGCVGRHPLVDADGDGFWSYEDCNDDNADINPGAEEIPCNGVDEDCDGQPDEAVPRLLWYSDVDGDGFGDSASYFEGCDALVMAGLVQNASDCDDADPDINPDAVEVPGNGIDEDCDGKDGEIEIIDADEDGYSADVDCNDDNSAIHPDAVETCNGFDDDCDELTDDADTGVAGQDEFYKDSDKDGYGRADRTVMACKLPDGYATNNEDCDDGDYTVHPGAVETCTDFVDLNCDGSYGATDNDGDGYFACQECDDSNFAVNPGATEVCDGTDNDCVGGIDNGVLTAYYQDADQDGYGSGPAKEACSAPAGYVLQSGDCDDARATVNPGASEVCNDRDDDCNSVIDEGVLLTFYKDADTDGFGGGTSTEACTPPAGYVANESDCNDTDKLVFPGAVETCNGKDDNCDGTTDIGAVDAKTWYQDADKDGYGGSTSTKACLAPAGYVSTSTDCDDANVSVSPTGTEVCNGKDDNCDGAVDNGAIGSNTYYADSDKDGYGDITKSAVQCSPPAGYVLDPTDCLDSDKFVYPGQTEVCNGKDDNCAGGTDEGVKITYYVDNDNDTYGTPLGTKDACSVPTGYSTNSSDCDDTTNLIHPGAVETCNGKDDNCNVLIDDGVGATAYYADLDTDTYGDATKNVTACSQPAGYVAVAGDCNDSLAAVNPGVAERPASVWDDDCNGKAMDDGLAYGGATSDAGPVTYTGPNLIESQFGAESSYFPGGTRGNWVVHYSASGYTSTALTVAPYAGTVAGGLTGLSVNALGVLVPASPGFGATECVSLKSLVVLPSTKYGFSFVVRNASSAVGNFVQVYNGASWTPSSTLWNEQEAPSANSEVRVVGGFTTGSAQTALDLIICTGRWTGSGSLTHLWFSRASF
ncbi:MAG: putative metal-binding motif-containing protein [Patescibacteria group bacterium]|jgi:hypothetical protein